MRIILTGGGTAGHITPLVSVADKLREKLGSKAEFLYIGSGVEMEEKIMGEAGIPMKKVPSGKIRRYFSMMNFFDFFKIPAGFVKSLWILFDFMPDVIFSKGGYVSIPVVLAAWVYKIPIMIHDSDSIPGKANQFLSKFSNRIGIAYPSAEDYFPKEITALVGNPIREKVTGGDAEGFRQKLEFTEAKKTILILGGSQGSQIINDAIVKILPQLLFYYQIIHQTGKANFSDVESKAGYMGIKTGHEGYYATPFMDISELRDAFALADLVISRAGATFITEIAANGKPAILVPITVSANDHQRLNAFELANIGAAFMLEETNLGENMLFEKIGAILNDDELRRGMIEKIKTFYHPNAAENIANSIIEIAKKMN
jgi:UDP-N-acetylglucosamine--N-acetylmuramyl-(pentapeptide) pyrophosphoryl-undecaprenol N-acetylglucosamine transferase